MFADRNCFKPAMKLFFGFVLAGSLLCARAPAQQLTSCTVANPSTPCIQKFVDPVPYPPFFQSTPQFNGAVDAYEIAARQFQVPMLSCSNPVPSANCAATLPQTTVWGYGYTGFPYDYNAPTTVCSNDGNDTAPCFSSPAPTIFTQGTAVHVKWINDVVCHVGDAGCTPGTFFPYPGAIHPGGVTPSFTNHTANPTGICNGKAITPRDCKGVGGYAGPVPLIVHAHGEVSASEDDGIPEAWNLPKAGSFDAAKYPFANGSDYCQADPMQFASTVFTRRDPNCATGTSYRNDGAARFIYPNRQFATTLFFHDHALGVTTENVYLGLAGFYLIGGTHLSPSTWCDNGPSSTPDCTKNPFNFADDLPPDCSLSPDGNCHLYGTSLTFPSVTGGLPQGDCSGAGIQAGNCLLIPLAIGDRAFNLDGSLKFSETGNVIIVNGKTWPVLNVQPRKYRFRIVVAAPTSRFDLTFPAASNNDHGTGAPVATMTQIGADGGLLPHPVTISKLSLMPGERADVIVDFQQFFGCAPPFGPGCTVDLLNANGSGDRGTIMRFNVALPLAGCDPSNIGTCFPLTADSSCNLSFLSCTSTDNLPHRGSETVNASPGTRQVSLFDDHLGNCPIAGCASSHPLPWDATVTETPTVGTTEIWEMYDFQDSHPMHLHEAQFQVINRENMTTHVVSPPAPGETGFKDTVQANAGQITRLRVTFQGAVGPASDPARERHPGLFAWHCHINPHEDNEMMRPMCVLDPANPAANTVCLNTP